VDHKCTYQTISNHIFKVVSVIIVYLRWQIYSHVKKCKYTTYCSRGESVSSRSVRSKRQGIRGVGRVVDKEAYTVHTINIIFQRQYFVARCLISNVGNVFGLHSILYAFSFYSQASDVGKTHRFAPTTVRVQLIAQTLSLLHKLKLLKCM
jgi:hypothetical protein